MNTLNEILLSAAAYKVQNSDTLLMFAIDTHVVAFNEDAEALADFMGIALNSIYVREFDSDVSLITFPRTELENWMPKFVDEYGQVFMDTTYDDPQNLNILDPKTKEEIDKMFAESEKVETAEPIEEPIETTEPIEPIEPIEVAEPTEDVEPTETESGAVAEVVAEPTEPEPIVNAIVLWHKSMSEELRNIVLTQMKKYDDTTIVATRYTPISESNGKLGVITKSNVMDAYYYGDILVISKFLHICDRRFESMEALTDVMGKDGWVEEASSKTTESDYKDMTKEEMEKLFIAEYGMSQNDANYLAIYFAEFVKALRERVVEFSYYKKDGLVREARGTLLQEYMPTPKGNGKPLNKKYQLYYDVEKEGLRSFERKQIISFK